MGTLLKRYGGWKAAIALHWSGYPREKQQRAVLYAFAAYAVITLLIVAQVIAQLGSTGERLEMEHISNPVAGRKNFKSIPPDSNTVTNQKREHEK